MNLRQLHRNQIESNLYPPTEEIKDVVIIEDKTPRS